MRARLGIALVGTAVCVLAASGASGLSSTRVESARYVGGTGDLRQLELTCETENVHIGGACFSVERKDEIAEVSVADESGNRVGWSYELVTPDGVVAATGPIVCSSVLRFELPDGFEGTLIVSTLTAEGVLECHSADMGPATSGIVAAGFYEEDDL